MKKETKVGCQVLSMLLSIYSGHFRLKLTEANWCLIKTSYVNTGSHFGLVLVIETLNHEKD